MMIRATFDTVRFLADVDAVRTTRNVTWNQVFRETACWFAYVSDAQRASTRRLSAQTLATLTTWAGLDPNDYISVESPDTQNEVQG